MNIGSKFDLLDLNPALKHFEKEKIHFDFEADKLERKLAQQFDLAFEQCNTTTQTTTLMQMLSTIMQRPKIHAELKQRYNDVVDNFSRELAQIKTTFDRGMLDVKTNGLAALSAGPGLAPVSGALKWIHTLRKRMTGPSSNFPYLDYE